MESKFAWRPQVFQESPSAGCAPCPRGTFRTSGRHPASALSIWLVSLIRVSGPKEMNSLFQPKTLSSYIVCSFQKRSLALIKFGIWLKDFKIYVKVQFIIDFFFFFFGSIQCLGKMNATELLKKKKKSMGFSLKHIRFRKIPVF